MAAFRFQKAVIRDNPMAGSHIFDIDRFDTDGVGHVVADRLEVYARAGRSALRPVDCVATNCHSTDVTLLNFKLQPGSSIFDQAVFAAIRAFVSGEFHPGQTFPSVRTFAAELKIHPNTAHKVIQHLIHERWLDVRPGVGTVVAQQPKARAGDRKRLLQHEVEELVVEAKRLGVTMQDLVQAIAKEWNKLDQAREGNQ